MAVVLDLVDPALADRRLEGAGGLAGLDEAERATHHQCSWDVVKAVEGS